MNKLRTSASSYNGAEGQTKRRPTKAYAAASRSCENALASTSIAQLFVPPPSSFRRFVLRCGSERRNTVKRRRGVGEDGHGTNQIAASSGPEAPRSFQLEPQVRDALQSVRVATLPFHVASHFRSLANGAEVDKTFTTDRYISGGKRYIVSDPTVPVPCASPLTPVSILVLLSLLDRLRNQQRLQRYQQRQLSQSCVLSTQILSCSVCPTVLWRFHEGRQFMCFSCGRRFSTSADKLQHLERHAQQQRQKFHFDQRVGTSNGSRFRNTRASLSSSRSLWRGVSRWIRAASSPGSDKDEILAFSARGKANNDDGVESIVDASGSAREIETFCGFSESTIVLMRVLSMLAHEESRRTQRVGFTPVDRHCNEATGSEARKTQECGHDCHGATSMVIPSCPSWFPRLLSSWLESEWGATSAFVDTMRTSGNERAIQRPLIDSSSLGHGVDAARALGRPHDAETSAARAKTVSLTAREWELWVWGLGEPEKKGIPCLLERTCKAHDCPKCLDVLSTSLVPYTCTECPAQTVEMRGCSNNLCSSLVPSNLPSVSLSTVLQRLSSLVCDTTDERIDRAAEAATSATKVLYEALNAVRRAQSLVGILKPARLLLECPISLQVCRICGGQFSIMLHEYQQHIFLQDAIMVVCRESSEVQQLWNSVWLHSRQLEDGVDGKTYEDETVNGTHRIFGVVEGLHANVEACLPVPQFNKKRLSPAPLLLPRPAILDPCDCFDNDVELQGQCNDTTFHSLPRQGVRRQYAVQPVIVELADDINSYSLQSSENTISWSTKKRNGCLPTGSTSYHDLMDLLEGEVTMDQDQRRAHRLIQEQLKCIRNRGARKDAGSISIPSNAVHADTTPALSHGWSFGASETLPPDSAYVHRHCFIHLMRERAAILRLLLVFCLRGDASPRATDIASFVSSVARHVNSMRTIRMTPPHSCGTTSMNSSTLNYETERYKRRRF